MSSALGSRFSKLLLSWDTLAPPLPRSSGDVVPFLPQDKHGPLAIIAGA